MKYKSIFLTIFIALAFLLSACGPEQTPTPTPRPTQRPQIIQSIQQPQRTLTVSGTGRVSLKPDMAYINVGVHTENMQASQAVDDNNTNTQNLINALKAAGVDPNDIQTTNFSIWQTTQLGSDGKTNVSIYAVDNTVYLTVRKLDQLGNLLDAAVKAGANNVNSIQFDLADKTQALSQARAEAVKTAKAQASELAQAAGVQLGPIQSLQYSDVSPSPILSGKGMGGGGGAANLSVPINPGQMEIDVSVTLTYALK